MVIALPRTSNPIFTWCRACSGTRFAQYSAMMGSTASRIAFANGIRCSTSLSEYSLEQFTETFCAFIGQDNRLRFAPWVADHPQLVKSIQRIPIVSFPGTRNTLLCEARQVKKGEHHVVDLGVIYSHF
jgi:hypothetical protein